ncbi:unnamed protein product [Schistocephalus solidus]|uniref:Secreted protein n=1 Tax=Schistocephalus solidus TaxID=70667 RepID=A0A183TR31_SCHSO|nr:unnamed protein product [Schistocephalus solidus]
MPVLAKQVLGPSDFLLEKIFLALFSKLAFCTGYGRVVGGSTIAGPTENIGSGLPVTDFTFMRFLLLCSALSMKPFCHGSHKTVDLEMFSVGPAIALPPGCPVWLPEKDTGKAPPALASREISGRANIPMFSPNPKPHS